MSDKITEKEFQKLWDDKLRKITEGYRKDIMDAVLEYTTNIENFKKQMATTSGKQSESDSNK